MSIRSWFAPFAFALSAVALPVQPVSVDPEVVAEDPPPAQGPQDETTLDDQVDGKIGGAHV